MEINGKIINLYKYKEKNMINCSIYFPHYQVMKRHSKNVVFKNALKKINKQKPNEILRNFEVINKIFCQIKEKNFISLHL